VHGSGETQLICDLQMYTGVARAVALFSFLLCLSACGGGPGSNEGPLVVLTSGQACDDPRGRLDNPGAQHPALTSRETGAVSYALIRISGADSYINGPFDPDRFLIYSRVVEQAGFVVDDSVFVIIEPDSIRITSDDTNFSPVRGVQRIA